MGLVIHSELSAFLTLKLSLSLIIGGQNNERLINDQETATHHIIANKIMSSPKT
jgi:hypothetical protein